MSSTESSGERVQSWMPTDLADRLRAHSLVERRSISQLVRLAVEDSFIRPAGRWRRSDGARRGLPFLGPRPRRLRGGALMATKALDERVILARGFTLVGRNLLRGQSLWSREDESDRSFSDDEVLAWLEQNPPEED